MCAVHAGVAGFLYAVSVVVLALPAGVAAAAVKFGSERHLQERGFDLA
jgi:hypothetical protein